MSLYALQAELHQLPEDHPAVLRAVVLQRLKGAVKVSEVRECIADLEAMAAGLEAEAVKRRGERVMDLLFIYTAILAKLHDARTWVCRYWLALVAVVAAVAISVALAAGSHLATLLVCGFVIQVCANVGVVWLLRRQQAALHRELFTAQAHHVWWANEARTKDEQLAVLAAENAQIRANLLAATEEKTVLRRWQNDQIAELIRGTREESP